MPPEAEAALVLIGAGYDPATVRELIDVSAISDPAPRFIRSRHWPVCSYCRTENHPDRENCKTCGAPQHAVA